MEDPDRLRSRAALIEGENPASAAVYYLQAAELLAGAGDGDGADRASLEALHPAGLGDPALLADALDSLRRGHIGGDRSDAERRALIQKLLGVAGRLEDARAHRSASRVRHLAWETEHELARRRARAGGLKPTLRCLALWLWRVFAGYGERPLRLLAAAGGTVYLFGVLYIGLNLLAVQLNVLPAVTTPNIYDLLGYFGISLAAFVGNGFAYASDAAGWILVSLEAVIGWVVMVSFVTVIARRLFPGAPRRPAPPPRRGALHRLWGLVTGDGERPWRLGLAALVITVVFAALFVAVNYFALLMRAPPQILYYEIYTPVGYLGMSFAALFGDGFRFAAGAFGWILVSLETVLGWLLTLALVAVTAGRFFRRAPGPGMED
ncbi:MAG: hypothetical protein A2Y64_03150 [Candidatus Coatesbacteria bacterium RBG_13_66_14]|uniref:Potassium channel domain-containing protein n=1 Tax=Candidatus Coatesbacteria bacterium RBG_13_66_14 TaxID=1817816 RepID=A0A1F5EYY8_9BACT|nr:MAG: hypothetical protein A2Y64_03150 [Candidatus Coatesbacteria bacterium RBG_13_66_14]